MADDFGAGIVIPETPPVQVATPTASASRALAEQLAAAGLSVPDNWNDETIADNLVAMQERAEKATAYEARIQEFEAQQVRILAEQTQQKPAIPETPSQAAARQRRYEKASLDQDLMSLVVADPSGRGFAPKDRMSPLHIQAAQQINEAWAKRSRVSNDFVDDPYGTVAELAQDLLDAQNKQWEERFKSLETKFTPIQEQMTQSATQQAESAFLAANRAKMLDDKGQYTAIGTMVDSLYFDDHIPLERALAIAEKHLGQAAPVVPAPASQSISKVRKEPVRDTRFVAGVHPSRLQNVPDSGAPPTGRMNSFNDFYQKHPEARSGRRN
jgi:hypothetical protein